MCEDAVQFAWREEEVARGFEAGVCLHGHTMHSREDLAFLPGLLRRLPVISRVARYYERGPRPVEFGRAWWTPPVTPASAFRLECDQIVELGLRPMVSLTDHDDIQAGLALSVTADSSKAPISVEWTVPYARSVFHLGVHNIPRELAPTWMAAMDQYRAANCEADLPSILEEFARVPDALIVLNHPFWLDEGVAEAEHRVALHRFLRNCAGWVDAFELNGTRRWTENAEAIQLARAYARPVISGGDRHAFEPSACINVTNASTFSEFASEIHAGRSSVLFLPQYREPMPQRILETVRDILREYPEYPGRRTWADRIFYRGGDNIARTLAELCQGREPRWLAGIAGAVQLLAGRQFRPALRLLLSECREEFQ